MLRASSKCSEDGIEYDNVHEAQEFGFTSYLISNSYKEDVYIGANDEPMQAYLYKSLVSGILSKKRVATYSNRR